MDQTVLEEFRTELLRQDRSEATVRNYLNDIQLFARWLRDSYGDEFIPDRIVQREIIEYRSYLDTRGFLPATTNRRLASLSAFFKWCRATGKAESNPVEGVKSKTITDPGPRAIDRVQLRRLLREVHVHGIGRDIVILEMLCGTALRVGELCAITLDDVDLSDRKGWLRVRNGKGRVAREIPLNVDVRKAISAWLDVRPASQSAFLILGQRGDHMTPSGVWRLVKHYAELAGIPDLRVHDLRHTVLTRLVREMGCDLPTVAKISGHRNLKTLMRYAEPTRDDLAAAVENMAFTG